MKTGKTTYSSDVFSFGVMLAFLLGYPSKLKKFEQSVFIKKKDKTTPPALEELVLRCTQDDDSKRPTFSAIATELIDLYNQSFRDHPPLVDEEATIAMDVATTGIRVRRTSSARKSKHRSLELTKSTPPTNTRQRGRVVLEPPNFAAMSQ